LIDNGYIELPVISEHVFAVESLPSLHKDPFDRILIAQAIAEGAILVTADPVVAQYPAAVRRV
jgi:PIN domain nuclease of toxin-antitoxin system